MKVDNPLSVPARHGWRWAYDKIRGLQVGRLRAAYRACRYLWLGDTGLFASHAGWRKSRISR